jgi:hypothetical protein
MPEDLTDRQRRARESAERVAALRAEVQRHHADADNWYAVYERYIAPYPTGAFPGNTIPAGVLLAYQRAAHHVQARAAAAAEATMEMMLAHLPGRA